MPKREKSNLDALKKSYKVLQEEYNLPGFDELNKDFQVERAAELETDYLVREIRKFMADKISNYLRFVEAILNPVNSPMFIFSVVKSIGNDEKEKLKKVYRKLSKTEINLISVDIGFSEKKEADFVRESFNMWKDVKEDLSSVLETVRKNWDNKTEGNNKGYFG